MLSSVMLASSLPCPARYTTEYVGAGRAGLFKGIATAGACATAGRGWAGG